MPLETDPKFLDKRFPLYYLFEKIHQIDLLSHLVKTCMDLPV